jgi:hypothetical protein
MQNNNLQAQLKDYFTGVKTKDEKDKPTAKEKKFTFDRSKIVRNEKTLSSLQSFNSRNSTSIAQQYPAKTSPTVSSSAKSNNPPPSIIKPPQKTTTKTYRSDEEDDDIIFEKEINNQTTGLSLSTIEKTKNVTDSRKTRVWLNEEDESQDNMLNNNRNNDQESSHTEIDEFDNVPEIFLDDEHNFLNHVNDKQEDVGELERNITVRSATKPRSNYTRTNSTNSDDLLFSSQSDSFKKLAEDYAGLVTDLFASLESVDFNLDTKKMSLEKRLRLLRSQAVVPSSNYSTPRTSTVSTPNSIIELDDEVEYTGEVFNKATYNAYDGADYAYDSRSNPYPDTPIQRDWSQSYSTSVPVAVAKASLGTSDAKLNKEKQWPSTQFSWSQEVSHLFVT